jgi:hypothetical protein
MNRLLVSFLVVAAIGCGDDAEETTGAGGTSSASSGSGGQGGEAGSGGDGGTATGGDGGTGGVDSAACLALCGVTEEFQCTGPDLEAGSAVITEKSASGCSGTVSMVYSGEFQFEIDCSANQLCFTEASTRGNAGCIAETGDCVTPGADGKSFGSQKPNCIQGGLSCFAP